MYSNINITIFVMYLKTISDMKKELTETEWELIEALRNFRKSYHNQSVQLELYIDELVDRLKDNED